MAHGVETGWASWVVFVLLLVSSSVVLVVQWNEECDGGLRTWLLTAVCVTAICGILGAIFHGRGDGTRPSRFLDDDDDYVDDESIGESRAGMDLGAMEGGGLGTLPVAEGGVPAAVGARGGGGSGGVGADPMDDEDSITSRRGSSISIQLASRASSSLQQQYFGPGPKVFPDAIFLILVVGQWFLAGWSVVGAVVYFRLFRGGRTCAPLLRHWTLLVVVIGFLSCLLAVCYSGIMCCMLGSPFKNARSSKRSGSRDRFHVDVASSDSSSSSRGGGGVGAVAGGGGSGMM